MLMLCQQLLSSNHKHSSHFHPQYQKKGRKPNTIKDSNWTINDDSLLHEIEKPWKKNQKVEEVNIKRNNFVVSFFIV